MPYQLSKYYKVAREEEIITSFNLNFLSLSNMEGFLRESREFDNFKEYLKIRNINPKKYFNAKKFGPVKEEKQVAQNKYFIVHPKELDQIVFINNYIEFINNIIISEFKDKTKVFQFFLLFFKNNSNSSSREELVLTILFPILFEIIRIQVKL